MPDDALNAAVAWGDNSSDSSSDRLGDVNNLVSAGTTAVKTAGDAALHGLRSPLIPEIGNSPIGNLMSRLPGAKNLAKMSDESSVIGLGSKTMGKLNTATSVLGTGMGIYNLVNAFKADNTADTVQAGADTAASIAGFFGPIGRAFSGGYSAGQLLDQGVGWLGNKIWGEGDHSLHHGVAEHVLPGLLPPAQYIRDAWGVYNGRGSEARQAEEWDIDKKEAVRAYRRGVAEGEHQVAYEKEQAGIRAQIEHLTLPHTMDTRKEMREQMFPTQYDEDGVPLPRTSLHLPPGHK